jgi:hypothetical protein
VFKTGSNNDSMLSDVAGGNTGFAFDLNGSSFRIQHGDGTMATSSVAGATHGAWEHFIWFADRSANVRSYRGGTNHHNFAISARTGSITNATGLGLLVSTGATRLASIAFVRVWKCTGCIGATANQDSVAFERAARLWGVYATQGAVPSAMSRASIRSCDIVDTTGERWLHILGNNAMCLSRRPSGAIELLDESAAANLLTGSATVGHASFGWSMLHGADSADADQCDAAVPDRSFTGDKIRCLANEGLRECATRQPITLTAAQHTFSVWISKYLPTYTDWMALRVDTIADVVAWFHSTNCTVGTVGAAVVSTTTEDWGGWCRVSITYNGTGAAHDHDIVIVPSDGEIQIDTPGTGNAGCAWGAQVEAGSAPSSYIPTTTAAVQRAADTITF